MSGVEISLRIGQQVRHRDHKGQRVTGVVHGLSIDSDRVLQADIVLDAAIVIPARSADDREISIWRQHVPAHELAPFDDRDELIAVLLAALDRLAHTAKLLGADRDEGGALHQAETAIAKAPHHRAHHAKATGAAS